MIDGITVINITEKMGLTNLGCIVIIAAFILLIIAASRSTDNHYTTAGIAAFIAVVLVISVLTLKQIPGTPLYLKKSVVDYQVLIDDSVSAKEFLKHYEVRDQIGESYIIRIKDENP